MARSRLEKVGTIFTRNTGLLRSGTLSWDDRPLWYDIYEIFPPFDEPTFERTVPINKLKNIFYAEDKIRALIHKNNKCINAVDLFNNKQISLTQRFGEYFEKIGYQYNQENNPDELVIDFLKSQKTVESESSNRLKLSLAFKNTKAN